ncbi:MAG TPA: CCA tRNA nucleotidyltransferase [Candidatus Acidoferrales bacterium]|nr:CCA tRNA nucleotidyltransferase [Candidatus Acidoferrales bacterium]
MSTATSHEIAGNIVRRLQGSGFSAFWVGGCVRDFLLGREPQDFDIATDARPEQIEKLFKKTIGVGRRFGVMVVVENQQQFQVATFRAEAEYRDGRRPEKVRFASAEADALRRDFTVNGLFYDPTSGRTHDWVGGEKDLRAKIIRTIGKPEERFAEDHLRLLRAVRFAAQLDFQIEPKTFAAVQSLAPKIQIISAERVRDELMKLFRPPHAARGLARLRDSGLLEQILPELAATASCEQSPEYHPEGTVFEHIQLMLEKAPPDAGELLCWAVLLHDIAKPATAEKDPATGAIHFYGHEKVGAEMAGRILERLRFPRKQIEEIVACVRQHMQFKDVRQMRKATLRRLLLRETFPLELELHRLDCLGSHGSLEHYHFLLEQMEELKKKPAIRPPLLTGNDLIALGMKPGPPMGALLNEIRDRQLAEELKTPRQAKAWAKRRIGRIK